MKIINKEYKKKKIGNSIKKNELIFFFFNTYLNISELMFLKYYSKNKNINFLITSKSKIKNIFYNSIYMNFKKLNTQICILTFKNSLSPTLLLAIKINNQIFYKNEIIFFSSFHYFNNKLFLFKFNIVNFKVKSK